VNRVVISLALLFSLVYSVPCALADIYGYQDENGHLCFPNRRAEGPSWRKSTAESLIKYEAIIQQASKRYGLEPSFVKAVIKAESDFDRGAVSSKGAQGLMQLMPCTADKMSVTNPFNPEENILGGTRYLGSLLRRFNHQKELALAAYNAGPEKVEECGGVPPIAETQDFVQRVIRYYGEFKDRSDALTVINR
jgi:soluble lytic murein transglycosylase-like protein